MDRCGPAARVYGRRRAAGTPPGEAHGRGTHKKCWDLLVRPHPQRPGRGSATPAATPRRAQPARLLRRRGLRAAGPARPAPFENGSISGSPAFKGVFLKETCGKRTKAGGPIQLTSQRR